jgi:hypothetical protein
MARSGAPDDDPLLGLLAARGADRAALYRQEAEKLRQMAKVAAYESHREALLSIAKEYDDLAAGLTPPEA